MQAIRLGIVGEDFAVASPVQRGFELLQRSLFREMLVEQIVKKFEGHGVIGLLLERRMDLLKQRGVGERRFAEKALLRRDVSFGECTAFRRDLHVAFPRVRKTEKARRLDDRQQIVRFEM